MNKFTLISVIVIAGTFVGVALHYAAAGRRALAGARVQPSGRAALWEKLCYAATLLSFLALAGTGFVPAIVLGEALRGYLLMAHTVTGGVFAVALTAWVLTGAERNRLGRLDGRASLRPAEETRNACFWLMALLGLISLMTMMLSMLPLFGVAGLDMLYQIHRWCGLGLVAVVIVHFYLRAMVRPAEVPAAKAPEYQVRNAGRP